MTDIISMPLAQQEWYMGIPGAVPRRKFDRAAFWERCKIEAPDLYADHVKSMAEAAETQRWFETPEGKATYAEAVAFCKEHDEEIEAKISAEIATWKDTSGTNRTVALATLGFSPNSKPTWPIIKKAYRRLARELHPDKGGDEGAMKRLNAAYRLLGK